MNLIPLRTAALASDLSPAALAEELRRVVGGFAGAPFAGSVADDGFCISQMNEFRSTIMPLLRGSIAPAAGGGSLVRLRLRPPRTVVVFMAVWLGFLAAAAGIILAAHAAQAQRSLLPLLAPAGLAAGSWWLMIAVFESDARWALGHLRQRVPALRPASAGRPAPEAAADGEELPAPQMHL